MNTFEGGIELLECLKYGEYLDVLNDRQLVEDSVLFIIGRFMRKKPLHLFSFDGRFKLMDM